MDLAALIERMDADDVGAFDQIVEMGERAVPVLVDTIARSRGRASLALAQLALADRVATLAPLIRHASRDVQYAAVRALAVHPDPRALEPLVAALDDFPIIGVRAVGDLGIQDGIEPLRRYTTRRLGHDPADTVALAETVKRAVEDLDPGDLYELAYCSEALAKLGDFSLREVAIELARFEPDPEIGFYEACGVRLAAVGALDVMVGPGIVEALDAATCDPDREVVEAAMEAMLHLGRTRAVPRWLELARREDEVGWHARQSLGRLIGEVPSDVSPAKWWMARGAKFVPDTCYVLGEPATPAELVERSRRPGSVNTGDRGHLAHMTGCAFLALPLDDPPASVVRALDTWWAANAGRFTPGRLHRWGRTYAPDAVT